MAQNILISIILIILYIAGNKWIKGHGTSRYISSGLRRKTDRILFATVILICSLFAKDAVPSGSGMLLFLSCMGVAIWDHTNKMHYVAAFGVAFVVAYLIGRMARDVVDYTILLVAMVIIILLVFSMFNYYLLETYEEKKELSMFASECEHVAFLVAGVYFLRKFSIGDR